MKTKRFLHLMILLAMFLSIAPFKAQAQSTPIPADMFQLPWEQGQSWVAFDGFDNGFKRPSTSPHNFKTGGAIDFAPRPNMVVGGDTSNDWVTAVAAGRVIEISFCHIKLDHGNGWISEYWHLDNLQVALGQNVSRNQRLAIIHNNKTQRVCVGNEFPGPHLHFVLRPKMQDFNLAGWAISFSAGLNKTTLTKNGQSVNRLQPILNIPNLQIVNRGLLNWDTNESGSVDPYRYERWNLPLTEQTDFTVTLTTPTSGLVPVIVLLNNAGVEITRANGVLNTSQPAGDYFIQIQADSGTGFYDVIATRNGSSTATPTVTVTPTIDLTQTTATPTIDLTQTTATPTIDLTQTTATPTVDLTQFPATATPTIDLTQTTATPTIDLTQTTATPTVDINPSTATVTPTIDLTQFPATVTPTIDLTQTTATPDLTQVALSFTPTVTVTPESTSTSIPTETAIATLTPFPTNTDVPTATPTVTETSTLIFTETPTFTSTPTLVPTIDLTQFPPTATVTSTVDVTQSPPTETPTPFATNTNTPIAVSPTVDVTQFPPTATQTVEVTQSPATATPTIDLTQSPATATATLLPTETPMSTVTSVPTITATAINTAIPTPSGPYVLTDVTQSPLILGDSTSVTVSLFNVPVSGYSSAEFTCTYNQSVIEANNIVVDNLFGADPASAIFGPQNGSFIVAIAGSNGNRASTNGVAFTFNITGIALGQSNVECTARVSSTGTLENISFIPDSVMVVNLATPTATPIPFATISGQVIANKPVTVQLFDLSDNLISSVNADANGLFNFTAPDGDYIIIALADGHLDAQGSISIVGGVNRVMQTVTLPAGDIDGNGVIDQFDALTIGMNYNLSLPAAADLNNDGVINVLDAELLALNYRLSGAVVWQ